MIRVCYIDESGCTGLLPAANSSVQPVLVIAGIAINQGHLAHLTHEFLDLKRELFPGQFLNTVPPLSHVKIEIKGADIRANIRNGSRNVRRHAFRYLDKCLSLLERYNAKIFSRVWIKGVGLPIKARAIYDFSIQDICGGFQNLLAHENGHGVIIADSRTPYQNSGVSHSIFTQKFKSAGDSFSRVIEMPMFGHSENHVGLQFSDVLCSGLIGPIAIHTYCTGHIHSVHVHGRYAEIKSKFAARLGALQHRYMDAGRNKGGIVVNDQLGRLSTNRFFVI